MHRMVFILPRQNQKSNIFQSCPCPMDCYLIKLLQCVDEVVRVVDVFTPKSFTTNVKVVHRPCMILLCVIQIPLPFSPTSNSSCARMPARGKPHIPFRISMYEYPLSSTIFCTRLYVILVDDFVGNMVDVYLRILVSCHWCVEIEIVYAQGQVLCFWRHDNTVQMCFH